MSTIGNGEVEILVAEDSPTQAAVLTHVLAKKGYRVTVARNGREALQFLERHRPHLIISDVVMPEMNGYELCKAVKSNPSSSDIPLMLVTTLSDSRDVVAGLESGADNFIRKPYDERYLLSRVEYLLMNREIRKNQKMRVGIEISLRGQRHFITAERQQILDLLVSTYEQAVDLNLELSRRQEDLARANRTLTSLYGLAESLLRAESEQAIAEIALDRVLEFPGVRAGWLLQAEGESALRLTASRNVPAALVDPGASDAICSCQQALLSGDFDRVINIGDCERLRNMGEPWGVNSHAAIPLRLDGRTLGILNLATEEGTVLHDAELQTLQNIGNQVAVALDRARLRSNLERLVEERTLRLEQEIARRRQAEERVRESEERYRTMFDRNPHPIWVFDLQTLAFLAVNDAAVRHYGYSREEFLGMTLRDIRPPEEFGKLMAALDNPSEAAAGLFRHRKRDGSLIDVEIAAASFQFGGRPARLVLAVDVTQKRRLEDERRQLEAQLAQERQVESLGRAAATIAHEFNNVLMGISPFAEVVQRNAGDNPRLASAGEQILKSVQRGKRVAQQILTFTRPVKLDMKPIDLDEVLASLGRELRASLPESCRLDLLSPGAPVQVVADRAQIEQVITNLVLNARDAMEGKGVVTLAIDRSALDGFVHLSCSDTGSGIPPDQLERIFEPLFTTKRSGTGLGLAVVHQVVKRHGGRITVESRMGAGTTFHLLLPHAPEPGEVRGSATGS